MQAALLAFRFAKTIEHKHEIKIERQYSWTDSRAVLAFLGFELHLQSIFVAHRVGEILENTDLSDWHWISTRSNPADDATRKNTSTLDINCRWFTGPDFLKKHRFDWQIKKYDKEQESIKPVESVSLTFEIVKDPVFSCLPQFQRFSSWERLLRATARLFAAVNRFRSKSNSRVTLAYLERAEKIWYQQIQGSSFMSEIDALKKKEKFE